MYYPPCVFQAPEEALKIQVSYKKKHHGMQKGFKQEASKVGKRKLVHRVHRGSSGIFPEEARIATDLEEKGIKYTEMWFGTQRPLAGGT